MSRETEKINIHKNHRDRVYERYISQGLDSFEPHEVLELLLFYPIPRRNVNPLAHALIEHFGSISGVMDAHPNDLLSIPEMTKRASVFLSLLPNAMRLYARDKVIAGKLLNNSRVVGEFTKGLFLGRSREFFYLLCLDAKCRLIQAVLINEGEVTALSVFPRSIVEAALRYNSSQVIFTHNHPSGNCTPSSEDILFTRRMAVAMATIDTPVIDHVIVNDVDFYSFALERKMEVINKEVDIRIATKLEEYNTEGDQ